MATATKTRRTSRKSSTSSKAAAPAKRTRTRTKKAAVAKQEAPAKPVRNGDPEALLSVQMMEDKDTANYVRYQADREADPEFSGLLYIPTGTVPEGAVGVEVTVMFLFEEAETE